MRSTQRSRPVLIRPIGHWAAARLGFSASARSTVHAQPVTILSGNYDCVGLPVAATETTQPSQTLGGITLSGRSKYFAPCQHLCRNSPEKSVSLQVGIEGIRMNWARSLPICLLLRTQTQPDSRCKRLATSSSILRYRSTGSRSPVTHK